MDIGAAKGPRRQKSTEEIHQRDHNSVSEARKTDGTSPDDGASTDEVGVEEGQYIAYGLDVRSEVRLDELTRKKKASGVEAPSINMRRSNLRNEVEGWDGHGRIVRASQDEVLLHYKDVGTFLIRQGREILFDAAPDLPSETLQNFLTGVCMGVLLHQRGALVLHASGVEIGERVAAFVGEKGMGKSTLAATFQSRGNALVTDDVLAITVENGHGLPPRVTPSFPQIKLWPDALEAALSSDRQQLPRVHPSVEKRIGRAETMAQQAQPLGCIFVLAHGEEIAVEPLSVQEAFAETIRHSYARRLLPRTGTSKRHFGQVSQLLQTVPMALLKRPRDLSQLPAVARAVEHYIKRLSDEE